MLNGRKVTVIIDGSNHGLRLIYGAKNEETPEEGFVLWRFMFLRQLFDYIEKFSADEIVIAIDSRNNWRKKVFPYYKGDRHIKRKWAQDKDETWFTFDQYYKQYDDLIEEIKKHLPIKILKIDTVEADDIAGVLAQSDILKDNHKIFVTTDRDYMQLIQYPFVKVFDPNKKAYLESDNPKGELLEKIILGDKGDYVPSIKDTHKFKDEFIEYCVKQEVAENETNARIKLEADELLKHKMELQFYEKYGFKASRVSTYSKKEARHLATHDKDLKKFLQEKPELKKMFMRNNRLVNLTAQPTELREEILNQYLNYKFNSKIGKLFEYLVFKGYNEFLDNTTKITNLLKPLWV